MGGRDRSGRRAGRSCRPGAQAGALLSVLLVAVAAQAEPCSDDALCLSRAAIRRCDADQAELGGEDGRGGRRAQMALLAERLALAQFDARTAHLAALHSQDALRSLRAEVTAWWRSPVLWFGLGAGVAASVVLILLGALS